MNNSINSASAADRVYNEERRCKQQAEKEREIDMSLNYEKIKEAKEQNALLKEQNKKIENELKRAEKRNILNTWLMVISICVALASLIVAILK